MTQDKQDTAARDALDRWVEMNGTGATAHAPDDVLPQWAAAALRRVLGNVPSIGVTIRRDVVDKRPVTLTEVLAQTATLGDMLGEAYRAHAETQAQLRALENDLAAFRRVLGTGATNV